MVPLPIYCFILTLCFTDVVSQQGLLRKEAYQTVPQLVTTAGYPIEKHRVTTEDGYILQLHRIPAGRRTVRKSGPSAKGKKTVLLCHGLLGSSGDFIIMGPDKSLAYLLADAGYDVWLANLRGNIYTSHTKYKRDDPNFWQYSFHEHGKYDLPASIDKVLNVTGLRKLMYIGYSMGTTSAFVMLSELPEYNEKLISFVALAPAVYMTNIKSFVESMLKDYSITDQARSGGWLAVSIRREALDLVIQTMCSTRRPEDNICMRFVYPVVGHDEDQYDPRRDVRIVGNPMICGVLDSLALRRDVSSLCILYCINYEECSGKLFDLVPADEFYTLCGYSSQDEFTAWEDGLWGQVRPYQLENIKVPVTLLYAENDKLADKNQIFRLARKLNATGTLEDIQPAANSAKFNHLDIAFAKDVGTMVNKPLVKYVGYLFNKYR